MSQLIGPVVCGGVGGSGTRLLALILQELNFFMGKELNQSKDLLLMGRVLPNLRKMLSESNPDTLLKASSFINESLYDVQKIMMDDIDARHYDGWGWKVPPNFFLIEYLNNVFPNAKYIHLIRNGLDMAYSSNSNQLRNWGFFFDIVPSELELEKRKNAFLLKYWVAANNFAISNAEQYMGHNFLLLNFEELCLFPDKSINRICDFLSITVSKEKKKNICNLIIPPGSIGRYKEHDLEVFDESDLKKLKDFGFEGYNYNL